MGTSSTTMIIEKEGESKTPLCKLYIHYDGYPDGVGLDIATFSKDFQIVNGFSRNDEIKQANGAGCFAAQLIEKLKGGKVGNVYLTQLDEGKESYNYEVIVEVGCPVRIICHEENFDGTAKEFFDKFKKEISA